MRLDTYDTEMREHLIIWNGEYFFSLRVKFQAQCISLRKYVVMAFTVSKVCKTKLTQEIRDTNCQ
jgi:hypothetical protein